MTKKILFLLLSWCLLLHAEAPDETHLNNLLTIITTTSPIPSNPNTEMLEITQKSLFLIPALRGCRKIIVFDGVPKDLDHLKEAYEAYKENVIRLTKEDPYFSNTELIFCRNHLHLAFAIGEALRIVTTPFIFIHQHDFQLIKDFDAFGLIRSMELNPNLKHIVLNRMLNFPLPHWNYVVDENIEGESLVPLCRTFGWSDNDHFSTVEYYTDFVLPQIRWKGAMEWFLHPAEVRETKENPENHLKYGTYFYGPLGDGRYLWHLDGRRYPDKPLY